MAKPLATRLGISFLISTTVTIYPLSSFAQYDDTPGARYSQWAVGAVCRMMANGVTFMQAFNMLTPMLMGGKAPLGAMQDYLAMSNSKNIYSEKSGFIITKGAINTCPNNFGRTEYNNVKEALRMGGF